jgi:GAF domain-containing protein
MRSDMSDSQPLEGETMAREDTLVESFVTLADTLVDDYDVIDFLETLAERCVELLSVSAAGIMLADPTGALRHAACSSERMRVAELFELQLEEGPCLDAYRTRSPIVSDSPEDAVARWPRFAPHALENAFASVAAVPMRLRAQVIGALNLFSTQTGALDASDLRVAQAMADVATIGILQERAIGDARAVTSQLEGALHSRIVIEQAKGIVAEHNHIDVDEAFSLIRRYVRDNGLRLRNAAEQIINGMLQLDELQVRQKS